MGRPSIRHRLLRVGVRRPVSADHTQVRRGGRCEANKAQVLLPSPHSRCQMVTTHLSVSRPAKAGGNRRKRTMTSKEIQSLADSLFELSKSSKVKSAIFESDAYKIRPKSGEDESCAYSAVSDLTEAYDNAAYVLRDAFDILSELSRIVSREIEAKGHSL